MRILSLLLPGLSTLVTALIAVLPWGLDTDYRFFLPMLPYVVIHYWAVRRAEHCPAWLVFVVGVLVDVAGQGPLGYWSAVYLIGYALALWLEPLALRGAVWRALLLLVCLGILAAVEWTLASLYFFDVLEWQPYARGAGLAGLAYLLIAPVLRSLDLARTSVGDSNASLTRGA